MVFLYGFLLGLAIGIAGIFVYRNNAAKAEVALKDTVDELMALKKKAGLK